MKVIILIIFAAFILTGIAGLFYCYRRTQRFLPETVQGKWRRVLALVPVAGFLLYCRLDWVNGIIAIVNVFAIWVISDVLFWMVQKMRKKPWRFYWAGVCAVVCSAVYLGGGWYQAHHVVATNYTLTTDKHLPNGNLRVLQMADHHLGSTFDGAKFAEYVQQMEKAKPDIVAITGDFVDDESNRADLEKACEALGKMKCTYGVFYVYGNHDKGFFGKRDFTDADMRKIMEKNGIRILEDEVVTLDDDIDLIGRKDRTEVRLTMQALMTKSAKEHYRVVLDHQPHDFQAQQETGADLVLCGHTHGGQMFPVGITGELSGANDMTYGLRKRGNTDFIVTSGISDWAIAFKTGGAISEYVVIDVKEK